MDDEKRDTLASLLSHSMAGEPESFMPFIDADPESDEDPRDVEDKYFDDRYRQSRAVHRQQQEGGDFQQLAQTFQLMQDMLRKSGCHNDLHYENIMVRPETNELVVNDPFIG
jgi:thiamine kinase-like enzyme